VAGDISLAALGVWFKKSQLNIGHERVLAAMNIPHPASANDADSNHGDILAGLDARGLD
jgi:hypothetical protein